jgi:phage FluMu protein Com
MIVSCKFCLKFVGGVDAGVHTLEHKCERCRLVDKYIDDFVTSPTGRKRVLDALANSEPDDEDFSSEEGL